jgi:hypothetical protein
MLNISSTKINFRAQTLAEFLFAIPPLLLLGLGLIQLGLYINAHQAVKLAAFKAARSFIVNNNLIETSKALEKATNAAAMSLVTISPKSSLLGALGATISSIKSAEAKKLQSLYLFKYKADLNKVATASEKYSYSKKHTKIAIIDPPILSNIKRGSKVTLKVDYDFNLSVPLAGNIFYKILNWGTADSPVGNLVSDYIPEGLKTTKICKSVTMQSEN